MGRNLVIARVGQSSLHPRWLQGEASRNWDLRLVPFQEISDQSAVDCEVGEIVVGPKWTGIREHLRSWDGWRDYDYIWMPDDDIDARLDAINRMFEVAAALELDLFAPALDESSHFAHFDSMRNRSFFGRYVGFVEIMVPAFSRAALEKLLPTLDLTETGWGWGLDSVWPKILGYEKAAILDGVTVTHTRPVGAMRDEDLRLRVLAESDHLLERYECRQEHVTFGAFDERLEPITLTPEELLARLVEGWGYLIDRDPRLLSWIAEFQRSRFGVPEYPVAGTP